MFIHRTTVSPRKALLPAAALPLFAALLFLPAAAEASPKPDLVGLQVEKPAGDNKLFSQGSGVLIGEGLVLTAAHVITVNPQDPRVTVFIDNQRVPGTVAYTGTAEHLDLALIKVDPAALPASRRGLEAVTACPRDPGPAQDFTIAWMGKTTEEKTILRADPPKDGDPGPLSTMLAAGHPKGASGGGVFDAKDGCLAGIMTADGTFGINIPGVPHEVTVFLPATKIEGFLLEYRARAR
ncbi:S1 family peptidase [Telmatospirillum siberiense]|uniref:Serine protease n=1 Tax=Telmatospirillum siberiense TaxID=382514 RepID=A0A2N3PPC4_9PROT|nr:serine protease [Telmatospirillum siberiense]PKU22242.1 hypothetical protein CWS72_22505 [Telmatospirillum siberiense]